MGALPIAKFYYHEQVGEEGIKNHTIELRPTSMEQGRHLVEAFFGGEGDTSVDLDTGRFYAPELFGDDTAKVGRLRHRLLEFFSYDHLPEQLRRISEPFCVLASSVAADLKGPEATVCLRKLLEAKDCAVRAALSGESE